VTTIPPPPNPGPGDPGDPNDPGLPNTGAPIVLAPLFAGLIMIAGGLGLVAWRRRFAAGKGHSSLIDGQL
jgi:LPXTG-motif cell wall-anchored protein